MRGRRVVPLVGIAVVLLLHSQHAWAALGEPVSSVGADRRALSATRRHSTTRSSFSVEELVSNANVVREYVSPSGIVFGIAWNGLSHPDLTLLLGSYASEYRDAARKAKRAGAHRSRTVRTGRVVVETWGHMRNLQGRAYAPGLLPSGVTADEIK